MFLLAQQCDALCLQNLEKMSVHEFITVSTFYIQNIEILSKPLLVAILDKIQTCIREFNELQLLLVKSSLEQMFMQERNKYANNKDLMFKGDKETFTKVEAAYKEIQIELKELQEEKMLIQAEDRITEEVRRRILELKEKSQQEENEIVKR